MPAHPPEAPTAVVLASDLLYLTREQQADLNRRLFALLGEYELDDPHRIPDGAERMAAMWSLIPDDRTVAGTAPEAPVRTCGNVGNPGLGTARGGRTFSTGMRTIVQNMVN